MEDAKAAAAAAARQQQQQQMLLLQQLQRQKQQEAIMSRFPSNIDAHLRPQRPTTNPNPQFSSSSSPHAPPNPVHPTPPPPPPPSSDNLNSTNSPPLHQKASRSNQAELQMAYQDAWRVCHPDFKRPFSSLEDACERLLPYHVVADYEAEEDDKILDSDTSGQMLSRSQQWDHNIAAKVAEFIATFEKQVLAFNIISRKRDLGEFRTEEKLMIEQLLLQEERRALLALREEMESIQKAGREAHDSSLRVAAIAHAERVRSESQGQAEIMARVPLRQSIVGSQSFNMLGENERGQQNNATMADEMINGWGNNGQREEKEPSEDFLNDEETETGDTALQSEWCGGGELDLNER